MKGPKLPKKMWAKGKSKHFYIRLAQEGIPFGNRMWDGHIMESPLDLLYKKLKITR